MQAILFLEIAYHGALPPVWPLQQDSEGKETKLLYFRQVALCM